MLYDRSLVAPHASEYLGLTQAEVATRLGISQSTYAQHESSEKLRKSTRGKIAAALGITDAQLDV
ncbi:helix-turn-helix domain-containing protein [Burkholderia pyrrocinia]|uniref:helix-turn-helix domain-containing protein n=1 Tax=Burkholderia pyrrocinia TaxID=60550 RepID=UPI0039EF3337